MYKLVKPLLFKLDPERAHGLTINALKCVQKCSPILPIVNKLFTYNNPILTQHIHGISFNNLIGLLPVFINLVKFQKHLKTLASVQLNSAV